MVNIFPVEVTEKKLMQETLSREGQTIVPWSESRSETPVEVGSDLADKNVRILNP